MSSESTDPVVLMPSGRFLHLEKYEMAMRRGAIMVRAKQGMTPAEIASELGLSDWVVRDAIAQDYARQERLERWKKQKQASR